MISAKVSLESNVKSNNFRNILVVSNVLYMFILWGFEYFAGFGIRSVDFQIFIYGPGTDVVEVCLYYCFSCFLSLGV